MGKISNYAFGIAIGFWLGVGASKITKDVDKVEVFPQGVNTPAVSRVYRDVGRDSIVVQNSESPNIYDVRISEYLRGIKNPSDRKIIEGQIEKVVRWYDEGGRE